MCSGLENTARALEAMGIGYEHVFSNDKDPQAMNLIDDNFDPKEAYKKGKTQER